MVVANNHNKTVSIKGHRRIYEKMAILSFYFPLCKQILVSCWGICRYESMAAVSAKPSIFFFSFPYFLVYLFIGLFVSLFVCVFGYMCGEETTPHWENIYCLSHNFFFSPRTVFTASQSITHSRRWSVLAIRNIVGWRGQCECTAKDRRLDFLTFPFSCESA